jgi:hypothetical protein
MPELRTADPAATLTGALTVIFDLGRQFSPHGQKHRVDVAAFASRRQLQVLMQDLSKEEVQVVTALFGLDGGPRQTQVEVGKNLRITLARVRRSQILAAVRMLRLAYAITQAGSYDKTVCSLGLERRVENRLITYGIYTLADLCERRVDDLQDIRLIGEKYVRVICVALKQRGLSLKS